MLGLMANRFLVQATLQYRRWYLQLIFTVLLFACVVVAYCHISALRESTFGWLFFVTLLSVIAVRAYSRPQNGIEQRLIVLGQNIRAFLSAARIEAAGLATRFKQSRDLVLSAREVRLGLSVSYPVEMERLRRHLLQFAITFVPSDEEPERSGYAAAILREFGFRVYVTTYRELLENPIAFAGISESPYPVFTFRLSDAKRVVNLLRGVLSSQQTVVTAIEEWHLNPNPLVAMVASWRRDQQVVDGFDLAFIGSVLSCLAPLTGNAETHYSRNTRDKYRAFDENMQ